MLELSSKQALAKTAQVLADSYELVLHGTTLYMPAYWKTEELGPCGPVERIWLPMTREDKRRLANKMGNILFANDSEITNFDLMLRQYAQEDESNTTSLLVRTEGGLQVLTEDGSLINPDGQFRPNCLRPVVNTNPADSKEVFNVISGWLSSDEAAHSLLNHLATALNPGWSAVKYLLLIGDGRNGKSVLLSMLSDIFGTENISNVTRQQIADRLPVCVELNNKLLNIVYDGEMAYIKDSSMEKTLIAGEPGYVRMLYENGNTRVQTTALFLEALNREPKTRDKSGALQKRLSRFWFPNVYAIDTQFEKYMRSERMLGAFLALLLEHFVQESEIAEKLQQTKEGQALEVEQQVINSPLMQYLEHLISHDPSQIEKLEQGGQQLEPLVGSFMSWRIQEGYSEYSTADVTAMFKEGFETRRKSFRESGKILKKWVLEKPKPSIQALLDQLKVVDDDLQ